MLDILTFTFFFPLTQSQDCRKRVVASVTSENLSDHPVWHFTNISETQAHILNILIKLVNCAKCWTVGWALRALLQNVPLDILPAERNNWHLSVRPGWSKLGRGNFCMSLLWTEFFLLVCPKCSIKSNNNKRNGFVEQNQYCSSKSWISSSPPYGSSLFISLLK